MCKRVDLKVMCQGCDYAKACDKGDTYIPSCECCDHYKDDEGCDDCRGICITTNCNFEKRRMMCYER